MVDGCATFYKSSKFEAVKEYTVCSHDSRINFFIFIFMYHVLKYNMQVDFKDLIPETLQAVSSFYRNDIISRLEKVFNREPLFLS